MQIHSFPGFELSCIHTVGSYEKVYPRVRVNVRSTTIDPRRARSGGESCRCRLQTPKISLFPIFQKLWLNLNPVCLFSTSTTAREWVLFCLDRLNVVYQKFVHFCHLAVALIGLATIHGWHIISIWQRCINSMCVLRISLSDCLIHCHYHKILCRDSLKTPASLKKVTFHVITPHQFQSRRKMMENWSFLKCLSTYNMST